jgi:hypothetical protein
MESSSPSRMAEKGIKSVPAGVNVNVPYSRPGSVAFAVKGPILKVFVDVTTPAVVINVTSLVPVHVVPFKDDEVTGIVAKALPPAVKNRTNSPTTKMLRVFAISKSSSFDVKKFVSSFLSINTIDVSKICTMARIP